METKNFAKINFKKIQDSNLQSAFKNLARDGIKVGAFWSTAGDSRLIIQTNNWKTVLGASDLGVQLESQRYQKPKQVKYKAVKK